MSSLTATVHSSAGESFIAKGGSMAAGLGDVKTRLHNQMNGEGAGAEGKEEHREEGKNDDAKHTASGSGSASASNAESKAEPPVVVVPPAPVVSDHDANKDASDTLD